MSFYHVSVLPKNILEQCKRDNVSSFECDIDTIKGYLTEIANTYLLVAYRIYEINRYKTYKGKYKNIVEACQSELGFKKSTTYNMINIVEQFGKPDTSGFISYSSLFGVEKFSYSQLCEMLSLSDKQRLQVTPDLTVKDIRSLKKRSYDNPGDNDLISDNVEKNRKIWELENKIKELELDLERLHASEDDSFQTSGNSDFCYDLNYNGFDFVCSHCKFMMDVCLYTGTEDDYTWADESKDMLFCPCCGYRIKFDEEV